MELPYLFNIFVCIVFNWLIAGYFYFKGLIRLHLSTVGACTDCTWLFDNLVAPVMAQRFAPHSFLCGALSNFYLSRGLISHNKRMAHVWVCRTLLRSVFLNATIKRQVNDRVAKGSATCMHKIIFIIIISGKREREFIQCFTLMRVTEEMFCCPLPFHTSWFGTLYKMKNILCK